MNKNGTIKTKARKIRVSHQYNDPKISLTQMLDYILENVCNENVLLDMRSIDFIGILRNELKHNKKRFKI